MGIVTSMPFMGACPSTPAADSRFWSLSADCRSLTVSPRSASLSGMHPYLHGVITAADVRNAAHAGHAAQHVQHVERRIVRKVDFVELGVGRKQRDGHQFAGGLLLDRNTVLHHLGRQACLGLLQPVLDIHGRQVGIRRNIEGHRRGETARVGARRLHIDHAGRTVQLLLDGRSNGLCHGLRVGTGYDAETRTTGGTICGY